MAEVLSDEIDYGIYERQTEAQIKVRPASAFRDELELEFDTTGDGLPRHPSPTGKLRNRLFFAPGETTMWGGYSGHKKSLYVGQIALDLMAQGRRVLIASMEMPPAKTLARLARQATGGASTRSEREAFQRWTDGKLWLFDHLGNVSPRLILSVARYFAKERKGTDIILDNFSMICESEESMDAQKQLAIDIVRQGIEDKVHMHVVVHCRKGQNGEDKPPTKHDVKGSSSITDLAHNVVTLWWNKPKFQKLNERPDDAAMLHREGDFMASVEKQRNYPFEERAWFWLCQSSGRFTDSRMAPVEPYLIEVQ